MQARTQSVLVQVCLALICAVGAGFSGDMQTRTAGHFSQHGRHTRGNHLRGARHSGRDMQGEHALDVEIAHDSGDRSLGDNDRNVPAILPKLPALTVAWTNFGFVPTPLVGFVQTFAKLQLPARAPPSLA